MGSSDSFIYDTSGKEVTDRKAIVLLTPPSFQISKFIQSFPSNFPFQYISLGQMIRDQINKKTNYSKIILQNLAKYKKVNEKILDILLKNAALQGNFIIKYSPKDEEDFEIWKKFMTKVQIEMILILKHDAEQNIRERLSYMQKIKQYEQDVKKVKNSFKKEIILEIEFDENSVNQVTKFLQRAK